MVQMDQHALGIMESRVTNTASNMVHNLLKEPCIRREEG